jgi:hypothetical protein
MNGVDANYLRDKAAQCERLARSATDPELSQSLARMGTEFLEKAKELDRAASETRPAAFGSFG